MNWIPTLLLAGASCAPGLVQEDDLERLVRKLGAPDPKDREEAERELRKQDARAEAALRRHKDSEDVEIRSAARRLLDRLAWNANPPILFRGGNDPPTRLFRLDPPHGPPTEVYGSQIREFGALVSKPRWAPNAAFASFHATGRGLLAWDPRGGEIRTLSPISLDSAGECAWSPTENALAFVSKWIPDDKGGFRDGVFEHVKVLRAGSGDCVTLTRGEIDHRDPCWSGDGKRLAYVGHDPRTRRTELFSIAPSGGTPEPLTSDGSPKEGPQWSPREDRIVFTWVQGDASVLAVVDVGKKEPRRLTTKGRSEGQARWSPDGKWIAFAGARGESGERDLFVIDAAGKNERQLTRGSGDTTHPCWSPDGRRIAFQREKDGHSELYVIHADGTGLAPLTKTEHGAFEPVWAPFR